VELRRKMPAAQTAYRPKLNHQAVLGLNSIVNTQEKAPSQIDKGFCNISSALGSYSRILGSQADKTLEEACKSARVSK
jgi:hypothetical protein